MSKTKRIETKARAWLRGVTYCKDSNAIYIKVRDTKIDWTQSKCVGVGEDVARINTDRDKQDRLVGVEILL